MISEQQKEMQMLLNACKDIGLAVNIGKTKYMEIGNHWENLLLRQLGRDLLCPLAYIREI